MTSTDFLAKIHRFQVTLGALAAFFGLVGFYLARNIDFTASVGVGSGSADYEIRLMPFNRLGALLILAVGVIGLVAGLTRKPTIGYAAAGGGSLHPANLLMLIFPDLFGASNFDRDLWGPPGFAWHDAFGPTGLYVAQNTGQVYSGALAAVAEMFLHRLLTR